MYFYTMFWEALLYIGWEIMVDMDGLRVTSPEGTVHRAWFKVQGDAVSFESKDMKVIRALTTVTDVSVVSETYGAIVCWVLRGERALKVEPFKGKFKKEWVDDVEVIFKGDKGRWELALTPLEESPLFFTAHLFEDLDGCNNGILLNHLLSRGWKIEVVSNGLLFLDEQGKEHTGWISEGELGAILLHSSSMDLLRVITQYLVSACVNSAEDGCVCWILRTKDGYPQHIEFFDQDEDKFKSEWILKKSADYYGYKAYWDLILVK